MTNALLADQLDQSIEMLLANAQPIPANSALAELIAIAGQLRLLPSPEFRQRLEAQLHAKALASTPLKAAVVEIRKPARREPDPLLSLFSHPQSSMRASRFAVSFLAHAAAVALLLSSGLLLPTRRGKVSSTTTLVELGRYPLAPAPDQAGGGGGGGDRDKLPASRGNPPRLAREQLSPPSVIVRNFEPRLAAEPTVVGPPNILFPQSTPVGDPLSSVSGPPSNGAGNGGGMGDGSGGGVGAGYGPGVGAGEGGGIGGGVFRVGGGVSAPRAVYTPDPEYSEEARQAKYQGTVILWVVVDPQGRPRDLRVLRSLGLGLDEKAIEAVRKWRFEPAMRDGQPVAVQVNVEVSFHLY